MTHDASWLQSLLESRRPDPVPVVGRWALGIGDMVADHPLTPDELRGLARKLNHFGGVAISEDGIEFDGDDVKWSEITEIRTRSLVEYLFSGGVDKQVDKLPLPWFPFRGKVIAASSRATLTLLLAAAKQQLEGGALEIRIPAEVRYHGLLGTRELSPGMLGAVVLADHAVRQCFEATAQARGGTLSPADDDVMEDADHRAEQIKSLLDAISARVQVAERRLARRSRSRRQPDRRRALRDGAFRRAARTSSGPAWSPARCGRRPPRRGPPSWRPATATRRRRRRRTGPTAP